MLSICFGFNCFFVSVLFFSKSRIFRFDVSLLCVYVCVLARVRLGVSAFVCAGVRAHLFMKGDCVNTFVYMLFLFADVRICVHVRLLPCL